MMLVSCRERLGSTGLGCRILGVCSVFFLLTCSVKAQINLIYQEGFNDDGDGTRYTMIGRGQEVLPVGPGMWEHNFNVDVIGLPSIAAEKRAAILWSTIPEDLDFTEDSLTIWDNLIDYMLDGKQGATIGFLPDRNSSTGDFLSFRLEEAGHTTVDVPPQLPDPAELDLLIQTEVAVPDPGTALSTYVGNAGYPVPAITFNAGNHDDELVSSIGTPTTGGPTQVTIVEANQDHPVLGGLSGTINWVDEFIADQPLQGIGQRVPAGSTVLATYVDPATGSTLPALLLIDKDASLLGAWGQDPTRAPIPEGTGYIVGGDMNERFPDMLSEFTTETTPRQLILNPVDVSGETGVKVAIALAASDVDFEAPDFLRISYAEDPDDEFVTLAQFDGLAGALVNSDLGELSPNEFVDYTFDIPDEVNNLVIKIEAFSTFPNEVVGFDNIRIFTMSPTMFDCNGDGVDDFADLDCSNQEGFTNDLLDHLGLLPGDFDGQGGVAFADFVTLSTNFGQTDKTKYTEGDIDGMGGVAFGDFVILATNFGQSAAGAAAAVPEPTSLTVLAMGGMLLSLGRRRR